MATRPSVGSKRPHDQDQEMKEPVPSTKTSPAGLTKSQQRQANRAKSTKESIEARKRKAAKNAKVLSAASEFAAKLGDYSASEAKEIIQLLAHQYGLTTAAVRTTSVVVGAVPTGTGSGGGIAPSPPPVRTKVRKTSPPPSAAWKKDPDVLKIEGRRADLIKVIKSTPASASAKIKDLREALASLNNEWRFARDAARENASQ